LASVDPSPSASIVALVDRALKSEPVARWQTAIEMQAAVRRERERLPSATLPRPTRSASAATLDEAMSVAGTANEVSNGSEGAGIQRLRPSPRWWPSLIYGALGAVVFLWIVVGRTEGAAPASPLHASTPTQSSEKATSSSPQVPTPAAATVASVSPVIPLPLAKIANSVQNASSATTLRTNEKRSRKPLPLAAESASPAPSRPNPRRLEDVLDERE
jgi:hypothetical protein